METYGIVKATAGRTAVVKVIRESACGGNCASCNACGKKEIETVVKNPIGAQWGDFVRINTSGKKVLQSAFFLYLLPILLFIAVYCAVSSVFPPAVVLLFSALAVALFYLLLKKWEAKLVIESEIAEIIRKA